MLNSIPAAAFMVLSTFAAQVESARVEVFGPGVLSNGEVFRGTFTPEGGTFYFFKKTGGGENYRIYSSNRTTTGWTPSAVVDLGGTFSDLYPAISRDGRRIVFSSYRPVQGQTGGKPNAHLWYADRTDNGWSAPVFMARTSTLGHYHSWVEFGFGDAIYFRRTTPDWQRNETMRAWWTGTEYSSPEPYADVERWKGWRSDVRVAGGSPGPGGGLVFLDVATINPRTRRPASDIWVSIRRGDGWTEPAPFGAGINSEGYDVFPFVSPDGRDLYFVRDFHEAYAALTSLADAVYHRTAARVAKRCIHRSDSRAKPPRDRRAVRGHHCTRGPSGALVRLADVARVELGAQNYLSSTELNGKPAAGMAIQLLTGANALTTAQGVRNRMAELERTFPSDISWSVPLDNTPFITASIEAVVQTCSRPWCSCFS